MQRRPSVRPGFLGDQLPPGAAFAAVVRSTTARGVVEAIDADEASALPGVLGIVTAEDLGGDLPGPGFARGEVAWAGQPVALVVAQDRATAEDGAGLVIVDIDPADAELTPPGPLRAEVAPGRLSFDLGIPRLAPVPPEPPGCVASWDGDRCALTCSPLHPGDHDGLVASARADSGALVVTHAGVGPVASSLLPAEVAAVMLAARTLGQPVVLERLRSDDLIAGYHLPGHAAFVTATFDDDGTVRELVVEHEVDGGAWCDAGPEIAERLRQLASGCYAIDVDWRTTIATSATAPTRGTDDHCATVASYVVERALDRVAAVVGIAPVELRRRHARDASVARVLEDVAGAAGPDAAVALVATPTGIEGHACIVDVDAETGAVAIRRYVAAGAAALGATRSAAPTASAAGLAAACFEIARYDEDGQPTTGTLIDYLVPSAADLARVEVLAGAAPPAVPAPQVVVSALFRALGLGADSPEPSLPLTPAVVLARTRGGA